VTTAGLLGSKLPLKPGELTLAHAGVLFLDELPEFRRSVLEALRDPLESGKVALARGGKRVTFPAAPQVVVGAMNLCSCGRLGLDNPQEPCTCSPGELRRYQQKLSAPLWDRFDMHIEVAPVPPEDLQHGTVLARESKYPREHRQLIRAARRLQKDRNEAESSGRILNGILPLKAVRTGLGLTTKAEGILSRAFRTLGLTVRGHDRLLRVARTIADMDESTEITAAHISEALRYRQPLW
jgi:magnesium chelatase family protein